MGEELIDIHDLGLQLKIPVKTIRNKLCNGTWPLRPVRIGRSLRWQQSEVDRLKRGEIDEPVSRRPVGRAAVRTEC